MRGDLSVIGPKATLPRRIAAGSTRFDYGEPLIQDSATLTSGVASANVFTVAAIDVGVIGEDTFGGIAIKEARPVKTGTLVAQTTMAACPIGFLGRIVGKAETAGNIDTAAELLAIIQDIVTINYDATGASDDGPEFTIKDTAAADTSAFQIVEGDIVKGTLDVTVDPRFYRIGNDITT